MDIFATDQPFEFGEARYTKGGRYGPVNQEHVDLAYLFYGSATVIADGRRQTFQAHVAVFTYNERNLEVVYPSDQTQHSIWCHTGQVTISRDLRPLLKSVPVQLLPSELLLTLFKEGAKLAHERSVSSGRVRNALGAAAFNEYFRLAHLDEEERNLPHSVYRAKRFLDNHFSEECDLKTVASVIGLSPHYLLQLFKRHVGVTPTRYMWKLRAQKGLRLLKQSGLTSSEIAYSCGFKTPHHFSRFLKQNYGFSPTEIREQGWMRDPAQFNKDIPDIQYE